MKTNAFRGFLFGVVCLALPVAVFAQYKTDKQEGATTETTVATAAIGKPAPQFALKDLDGKEHKLADFKGKVVVLEWSNHQCPFCVRHAKDGTADQVMKEFKDKPVVWIAIDSSNVAPQKTKELASWKNENKLGYPILIDGEGTVGKAYGAKTTPHMFVIDQKGTLVYAGAIDDDPTGAKETSRNYITEALEAIFAGTAVPISTTKPYGCSVKYKS